MPRHLARCRGSQEGRHAQRSAGVAVYQVISLSLARARGGPGWTLRINTAPPTVSRGWAALDACSHLKVVCVLGGAADCSLRVQLTESRRGFALTCRQRALGARLRG